MRILALGLATVLVLSAFLAASVNALEVYLNIHASRYGDSVLLNISTALQRTLPHEGSHTIQLNTVINVNSLYLEKSRELIVNTSVSSIATHASARVYQSMQLRKLNAELHLYAEGDRSSGVIHLEGFVNASGSGVRGTIRVFLYSVRKLVKDNVSRIVVHGEIVVDKSLIPSAQRRFIASQLAMLSILGPSVVNRILKENNVTWIKFEKLNISVSEDVEHLVLKLYGVALLNSSKLLSWLLRNQPSSGRFSTTLGAPSPTPSIPFGRRSLAELVVQLPLLNIEYRCNYTIEIHSALQKYFNTSIKGVTVLRGDVEKYFRLLSRFFSRSAFASMNASQSIVSEVRKYLSELVILPYNTSAYISISRTSNRETILLQVRDLRIGHAYLRGSEAVSRIGRILASILRGFERACIDRGFSVMASVSGVSVELKPDPHMSKVFETLFKEITWGGYGVPWTKTGASSTTFATQLPFTVASTPSTLVKYVTRTLVKELTVTSTTTATLTKSVTVTKTVTTTTVSVTTTTKVVQNAGLCVAMVVVGLAVGLGVGLFVRRR